MYSQKSFYATLCRDISIEKYKDILAGDKIEIFWKFNSVGRVFDLKILNSGVEVFDYIYLSPGTFWKYITWLDEIMSEDVISKTVLELVEHKGGS